MPPSDHRSTRSTEPAPRIPVADRLEQYENRQRELTRLTSFLFIVVTAVLAWLAWPTIRALTQYSQAYTIGLVVLVALFAAYVWERNSKISELRSLVHGIEQRTAAPPGDRQLEQLFEVISRSQQGFRDLIDSFDDILLALTLDGQIRAVNRSFTDLAGASFQDLIGRNLSEFLEDAGGQESELLRTHMPRFLERRTWSGILTIRLKRQNTVYYFDCTAHAMTRGGEVHGITVLARDITALKRNEARFTELFETLQEGIYITTPAGDIVDVNPALVRILGYSSKEELLARKVPEIFRDRDARKSVRDQVDRQPVVEGREITLIRKDGSPVVCLNTAAAVRDNSGRVIRYQGALMDISAHREMERRLHQQQELARRLVDSFPDLILVLDAAARYTFISPRIEEVLGYTAEEEREQAFGNSIHAEDRPSVKVLLEEILAGRRNFASLEVRVRHKKGDWRRLRCHFSPLADENGAVDGVVISSRDVTELKRLEEQLIQAEKLAAMGQMLAGVAHELNNPLTAILGVTELLSESDAFPEAAKRQLSLTHRQARRAARIVHNLLEFARPASPQKTAADPNSIIERTLQLHEHSLRQNNISVDFRPQPDIPEVTGDANQLIQVFLNLLANAEYAIREVRENGRIQIRLGHSGGRVSFTVQDDGVGIPAEAFPRLFDPFFTTKRPGGGTGLGLSICLSIIQEHQGTIEAESLPAGGSAFTVYLPAVAPAFPAAPAGSLERISAGRHSSLEGCTVLVLDDEEPIRMLLEEGLKAHGLEVYLAATAEEALALAAGQRFDALLCDLHLSAPGRSLEGEDVVRAIEAMGRDHHPVTIYMTGDLVDPDQDRAHPDRPRRLQKPFRISDVLDILKDTLLAPRAR